MGAVTAAVVGGAAVSMYGAHQAGEAAKEGSAAQERAAGAMRSAFNNIQVPTIEEQKIILQTPALMGEFTPEQLQAMELNASAMEGISADQGTIDAQNQALEGIGEVAQGGYSESDKATAREVQRTVSQDAQARKNAILNSMAQRGVLGSGMELAAQLQSNQQAAEQMSRGGEGLTQQAQARALQALGQQGSLASQMRGQQFGEKSDIARAQDAINQFNTQNRQNISNSNVGNRNQAQMYNLGQRQSLEDQRAANANQQQIHNKGLIQSKFNNETSKAAGVASAEKAVGDAAANAANARAAQTQGMYSAIAGGLTAGASMYNSNQQADKIGQAKYGDKWKG